MFLSTRQLIATGAAAALLLGSGAAFADVKAGVDAWMAGRYDAAVSEWRPLAEKGDADAQFNLGQAYKLGRGVPADLKAAQSWYEKAAKQGHEQAQANLGLILFQNGARAQAMPWIRKAAEGGDPRAQYVLGTALFNGDLVGKDWPRAYALMMSASEQGLPQAATSLEQMNRFIPLQQRQQGIQIAARMNAAAAAPAAAAPRAPRIAGQVGPRFNLPPENAVTSKAPAPARTATPAAAPVPAKLTGKGWRVQLGAFGNTANAQRAWAGLRGKIGAFASLQPHYVPAGAMTRLQAGPVNGRAAADQLCAAAKAAGSACFPIAP